MVINRPNGSDVYAGVLKDYTGEVRPARGPGAGCGFLTFVMIFLFCEFLASEPH